MASEPKSMDEAIRQTVQQKEFKKTNLEKQAKMATNRQVGGSHYKDCKIQPIDYIMKNNLGFCEGNVVKYISRWNKKGGTEDLRKAIRYIEILLDNETN